MRGTKAPEILFRDDFSSGTLDPASWTPNWLGAPGQITKPINGAEANCYDPACATVRAGAGPRRAPALVLSARAGDAQVGGTTYHYRSGCVTTHGKHMFTAPCRLEAKILMPGDEGEIDNWPGFWTDGASWPQDGENDIVEGLHGHAAFHVHDGPNSGGVGGNGALVDRPQPKPGTIGWHRFRSDWYPDHIDYAYDGQHVGSVSAGVSTFAGQQHYLILNYALSSSISPPIVVPSEMVIAWVQVSKL
jgi:beta-glucanase (GH16 family)